MATAVAAVVMVVIVVSTAGKTNHSLIGRLLIFRPAGHQLVQ